MRATGLGTSDLTKEPLGECSPTGTILVLEALDSPCNWHCMSLQVPEVRRAFPEAPIILLVPRSTNSYRQGPARLFGVRLSEIRQLLGWEWMLAAWWGRERETSGLLRALPRTG